MGRAIQEENEARVQEAFDTRFNGRDYAAAESGTGFDHRLRLPF
jgi:hypothetical protein